MKIKNTIFLIIFFIILASVYYLNKKREELKILGEIDKCNDTYCFQDFFEKYTKENGTEKAINLFKKYQDKDNLMTENCHYIFHGIGHGSYILFDGDIGKAFTKGSTTEILMNIPTCGNGYYHGIIEEYVGEEKVSDDVLINKLKSICKDDSDKQVQIDCLHGLGHAIFIHENKDIYRSIYLCDSVISNGLLSSMCHTGIFMEMIRDNSPENKVLTFSMCESLDKEIYRAECFNQHSYLFGDFSKNKDFFVENMKKCEKDIADMEARIICIRKEKF